MVGVIDPLVIDGYLVRTVGALARAARGVRPDASAHVRGVRRAADQVRPRAVRARCPVRRSRAMLMDNNIENAVCRPGRRGSEPLAAPVNGRLTAAEVAYIVGDLEPAVVVVDASHLSQLEQVDAAAGVKAVVVVGGGAEVDVARLPVTAVSYDECVRLASAERLTVDIDARDPAFILYTSGTTGRPKGAVLGHAGYVTGTLTTLHAMRMSDRDEVRHVAVPMFHSGGLNSILQQLVLGGPSLRSPSREAWPPRSCWTCGRSTGSSPLS